MYEKEENKGNTQRPQCIGMMNPQVQSRRTSDQGKKLSGQAVPSGNNSHVLWTQFYITVLSCPYTTYDKSKVGVTEFMSYVELVLSWMIASFSQKRLTFFGSTNFFKIFIGFWVYFFIKFFPYTHPQHSFPAVFLENAICLSSGSILAPPFCLNEGYLEAMKSLAGEKATPQPNFATGPCLRLLQKDMEEWVFEEKL